MTARNENGPGSRQNKVIRIGTINVSTMNEKEEEIVEMMKERRLDILGICETRMKNNGRKIIHDDFQLMWSGGNDTKHGVAIVMTPEMAEKTSKVTPKNERMISIELDLKVRKLSIIQVYTPQQGRPVSEKEAFYR